MHHTQLVRVASPNKYCSFTAKKVSFNTKDRVTIIHHITQTLTGLRYGKIT